MEKKLKELLLVLGGCVVSMFAAVKILRGGWEDMLWVAVILSVVFTIILLGLRNWWPVLAIVMPLLPQPNLGIALLERITPMMVFNVSMVIFFIANMSMRQQGVSLRTKYARSMLLVAVMITVRLFMDVPGSGRIGESGGLGEALSYLIAGFSFFSIWWATLGSQLPEKKMAGAFLVFGLVVFCWKMFGFSLERLYHRTAWLLYPFLLAWIAHHSGILRKKWLKFHVVSCLVMACSVVSPHRKSLVMAGLVCMALAWIFRVEKKQLVILAIVGSLGFGVLSATGHVPKVMKRALSTIMPSLIEESNRGYMGLKDDFRTENLKLAMEDISSHPFIGRGFVFSTAEVVSMLERMGRAGMAGASDLAAAVGIHHYGFFSLMTHIGAIVPWFYAFAGLGIFIRFLRNARNMPDGYPKVLAAGLVGYFINNLFQWLFNGAGEQMLLLSTALGVMMGLQQKWGMFGADRMPVGATELESGVVGNRKSGEGTSPVSNFKRHAH